MLINSLTLNCVFDKGTKLLILLQDDHQIVRPGEEGKLKSFNLYAKEKKIPFYPEKDEDKDILTLVDEKRCKETLFRGLNRLLFNEELNIEKDYKDNKLLSVDCVEFFNSISDLEKWKNKLVSESKTKYIFPFCWPWLSRNTGKENEIDIEIGKFQRQWNPSDTDEQVLWLNDNKDDRVACIYTSQGLDMDNVAFVWWDDLKWNENESKWDVDIRKLKDSAFISFSKDETQKCWTKKRKVRKTCQGRKTEIEGVLTVSEQEMNILVRNTYYVILSRPRHKLGIWFKDEITKKHVAEIFGKQYTKNTDE